MTGHRRLAAFAAALAVVLVPASAHAAGGVSIKVNDATKWPARQLLLSLPAKRVLDPTQLQVRENGLPVHAPKVLSEANNRKRGVMLAIDASLTMRGEPIREAMVAARSFARHRSPNTPVGVIFFSGTSTVALKPTREPTAIRTTLAVGPALTRGTKIFDAAASGIAALHAAGLTSGAIIVLSDGAEAVRGSTTTIAALASQARQSNVRIFSVGLDSHSFNSSSLRAMAGRTGGRYGEASRPQDLPPLFAALGERLSSEYTVNYNSTAPAATPVVVRATIDGFPGATTVGYTTPQLSFAGAHPKFATNPSSGLDQTRVIAIAGGLFVLLALVMYMMLRPKQRSLVSRVTEFSDVVGTRAPTLATVRRRKERKPSDRWRHFSEVVELAGIGVSPAALVLWAAIATVLVAGYFAFPAGKPGLSLLAIAIPIAVRVFVVSRLNAVRRQFADQLPDNLQVLASALRAGYSFSAGISSMAQDASEPSRGELQRASADEQLGMDLSDALKVIARRMDSPEIEYVGIVAKMQRESGGNTAEVLDQVIETIRARQQLKRTVRTLTAQGRMGGAIISASPIVVSVGMAARNPGYFDPMLRSTAGVLMLIAAVFMLCGGWLIIRKIVNVEP